MGARRSGATRTGPGAGLRRLVLVTLAATFALVVLGGVVRVSDSGLGCGPAGSGLQGWPLCRGDLLPGLDLNAVIEYAHRALASGVGLLMIALAVVAWRRRRTLYRGVVWATFAAVALVVAQGLLGAVTVELNLAAALVAAHLGLAMLLLGLLLYVWQGVPPEGAHHGGSDVGGGEAGRERGLRWLALAASAAVLCTIVVGGYMAGTEKYGRADRGQSAGAHYACGTDFPACNGSFMPFGQSRLADVHLTHRAFMYLTAALVVALAIGTLRRRARRREVRLAASAAGLLALQILLGALNVWITPQYEGLILAHLTVATLLWMSVAGLALELGTARTGRTEATGDRRSGARPAGEPVTA
jgi:heme A synthase